MKTLVIIPAYNEEGSIGGVIDDIQENYSGADIVVINDGSFDDTKKIAESKNAAVVSLPFNLGIGSAVQTGYRYAMAKGYDVAVQFDGDNQHKADQLESLLEPLFRNEADFVIGSRFLGEERYRSGLARFIGIRILSSVLSVLAGRRLTDPTSGFRAANKEVIRFFCSCYPDDYPEPETIYLVHRAKFRIAEVPALMRERESGASSITPVRALYYMIKVLLAIGIDVMKRIPKAS